MSRQKKAKKTTCVTREAKESLGTILAEKILGFAPRISCQFRLIERDKEMFLFELQTVGFSDSKNATKIADIEPMRIAQFSRLS